MKPSLMSDLAPLSSSPQRTIGSRFTRAAVAVAALALTATLAVPHMARAQVEVQKVQSPGGIKAWLMEDRSVPLITLNFAFKGGGSQDLPGKEGTAAFLSQIVDEGAGKLTMTDFQRTIARLGIKVQFSSNDDWWSGSIATLEENRDEAAALIRSVLIEPRLDQSSIDRMRSLFLTALAQRAKSPNYLAAEGAQKIAFAGHRYSRPALGTPQSLATITRDDIENYRRRVLARDNLVVSASGAINAADLGNFLDRIFADLPAKAQLERLEPTVSKGAGQVEVVDIDVPQSVAVFQMPGVEVADPDYMAARIMALILASGGFESRLMQEIRVKRGLAYGVSAALTDSLASNTFYGTLSTRNEAVAEAMSIVKAEFKRMASDGPTEKELADTKSNMIGSFAMNFDTIGSMTSLMQSAQLSGLGVEYFKNRSAMIETVSTADVKRVATRILDTEKMLWVVAGKPKGITTTKARM